MKRSTLLPREGLVALLAAVALPTEAWAQDFILQSGTGLEIGGDKDGGLAFGDFNGDGFPDVIVNTQKAHPITGRAIYSPLGSYAMGRADGDSLAVFLGEAGPALFVDEPAEVEIDVPDEGRVWLEDVDGDGRADVVLHHEGAGGAGRVTLLLGR